MLNSNKLNLADTVWREKVYIETPEHVICGYVYMPKTGKQNRMISDILSAGKSFIAVKDCTTNTDSLSASTIFLNNPNKNIQVYPFLQVNLSSVIIMRPTDER